MRVFLLLLLTGLGDLGHGLCPVSLPQSSSAGDPCYKNRQANLENQRNTFGLKPASDDFPFSTLAMSPLELLEHLHTDPFLGYHAKIHKSLSNLMNATNVGYKAKTAMLPSVATIPEYAHLLSVFHPLPVKYLGDFVRGPADHELFQNDCTKWISDELFADQRLAGTNPMSIQRVSFSKKYGLYWKDLKKLLNPTFDWNTALRRMLPQVPDDISEPMHWAIKKGFVFALRLPMCDDMPTMEDLYKFPGNGKGFIRTMWPLLSPIALFLSVPSGLQGQESTRQLMPMAIQMDYKPDSRVLTPKDGGAWTLAKLNVQLTDFGYSQLVEHLSKVHFRAEVFCISLERHLSTLHPLYAMMRFHCRGVMVMNTFGAPKLINPGHFEHHLHPYGWIGAYKFLQEAAKVSHWDDLDLRKNTAKRGVSNRRNLPYYPYRDDGLLILKAIENFVTDYINIYYGDDNAVVEDSELQNFVSEISADGTGPYGGIGQIRGFPPKLSTKAELHDVISRMIWTMSPQHSAVNYPANDYGSYVPNSPTKLYNDTRGSSNGSFTMYNLEHRQNAALQQQVFKSLGLLRLDRLFDYGPYLDDQRARNVLSKHYDRLNRVTGAKLEARNAKRYQDGHLTYPYMLPRWLPNGIQT